MSKMEKVKNIRQLPEALFFICNKEDWEKYFETGHFLKRRYFNGKERYYLDDGRKVSNKIAECIVRIANGKSGDPQWWEYFVTAEFADEIVDEIKIINDDEVEIIDAGEKSSICFTIGNDKLSIPLEEVRLVGNPVASLTRLFYKSDIGGKALKRQIQEYVDEEDLETEIYNDFKRIEDSVYRKNHTWLELDPIQNIRVHVELAEGNGYANVGVLVQYEGHRENLNYKIFAEELRDKPETVRNSIRTYVKAKMNGCVFYIKENTKAKQNLVAQLCEPCCSNQEIEYDDGKITLKITGAEYASYAQVGGRLRIQDVMITTLNGEEVYVGSLMVEKARLATVRFVTGRKIAVSVNGSLLTREEIAIATADRIHEEMREKLFFGEDTYVLTLSFENYKTVNSCHVVGSFERMIKPTFSVGVSYKAAAESVNGLCRKKNAEVDFLSFTVAHKTLTSRRKVLSDLVIEHYPNILRDAAADLTRNNPYSTVKVLEFISKNKIFREGRMISKTDLLDMVNRGEETSKIRDRTLKEVIDKVVEYDFSELEDEKIQYQVEPIFSVKYEKNYYGSYATYRLSMSDETLEKLIAEMRKTVKFGIEDIKDVRRELREEHLALAASNVSTPEEAFAYISGLITFPAAAAARIIKSDYGKIVIEMLSKEDREFASVLVSGLPGCKTLAKQITAG